MLLWGIVMNSHRNMGCTVVVGGAGSAGGGSHNQECMLGIRMVNKRQGAAEEAVAGLTAAGLRYKMVLPALYFLDRGLRHPALVLVEAKAEADPLQQCYN